MSQIQDIANFVTTDVLNRSDLGQVAIDCALDFYKVLCFNVPFDELMVTSAELPTTNANTDPEIYDLSSLIPALKAIASIRITFSTNVRRRLRRSHTRVYDALSFSSFSRPATYARWGTTIQFNPPSNSTAYTFRVRYWSKPTIATPTQNTVIQTPDEWDELIRWETVYRVLNVINQPERAAMLIQPTMLPRQPSPKRQKMFDVGIIPRLWNELLTTISQKENVDEDFSINPVVRAYTYRGK